MSLFLTCSNSLLTEARTNAETQALPENQSATNWNSGITEPQSSFVRELKKELGMRSEGAARKADMARMY